MDVYDYKALVQKALAFDATQEDINALGDWFDQYGGWGRDNWNGECYHVDRDHDLYPIHREVGYEEYEVVGYTFSSHNEDRFIPLPFVNAEERAKWEAEEEEKAEKQRREQDEEERIRREEAAKVAAEMSLDELIDKYHCYLSMADSGNTGIVGVKVGRQIEASDDMALGRIRRNKKKIKEILLSREAEKQQWEAGKQRAKEEREKSVPGLQELRWAVKEYYGCMFKPGAKEALNAIGEKYRRAAAYYYASAYATAFDHDAGTKAMEAISRGEDITNTLHRMRNEGGSGRHATCLLFSDLFE